MLVIDNILYLEVADGEQCGLWEAAYLYKEKSRGAKWATFIKHPVYKNLVLVEFESLHPSKKKIVTDYFGNPYEYHSKAPIRKMVERDTKAEAFYLEFSYGTDLNSQLMRKIM